MSHLGQQQAFGHYNNELKKKNLQIVNLQMVISVASERRMEMHSKKPKTLGCRPPIGNLY